MSVSLLDVEFFIQWNLTVKDSSHFASCSVSVKLTLGKEASERVEPVLLAHVRAHMRAHNTREGSQ